MKINKVIRNSFACLVFGLGMLSLTNLGRHIWNPTSQDRLRLATMAEYGGPICLYENPIQKWLLLGVASLLIAPKLWKE